MPELWNKQLEPNEPGRFFKGFLFGFGIVMLFFWIPLWIFLWHVLVK